MRDRAKRIRYPLFTLLDALSVALSFNLAFVLFEILEWQSFTQIDATYSAVLLIVLTCISHLSVGLYEHKVRENIRQVLRRATLSAGLVFLAYQALLIPTTISPHNLTIVSGLLLSVALQATWRYWLVFTGSAGWAKRNVVFIGAGERAAFICRRMRRDVDRKNFS
jgi:FlaA1/EpsC-like NDP-sugar epimerase